ncbi:MAG TPA: MbtH family NRPS accessory protein [Candidatus Angelobacter sp.]|jgi:MbtH protein|nr:MbtH family NRPS accessory protein [Candidatus Angelobacter sp.]
MDYKTPEDNLIYMVVRNADEQYSIWPAVRQLPLGWEAVPKTGSLDECLTYISDVWTDMRPLSARQPIAYLA